MKQRSSIPSVAVYLKNGCEEYDLATTEFLDAQFANQNSPANGLITYTVVAALTAQNLAGSAALIIDESADNSLTAAESAAIRAFVASGGKVGLFTFPRFYWSLPERPNLDAYKGIADLFGITAIGDPIPSEHTSGRSSAVAQGLFSKPYAMQNRTLVTTDWAPFTPITSTGTTPLLVSPSSHLPVAVTNANGLVMTNPIGDEVEAADANSAYHQFVTNAIVWLAGVQQYTIGLPLVAVGED